jgi:hypothetical protein
MEGHHLPLAGGRRTRNRIREERSEITGVTHDVALGSPSDLRDLETWAMLACTSGSETRAERGRGKSVKQLPNVATANSQCE